jgi:hypothetical protein
MLSHLGECCRYFALPLLGINLGRGYGVTMPRQIVGSDRIWQEHLELLCIPALSVDELSGCPDKLKILHCGWTSEFRLRSGHCYSRAVACEFGVTRNRVAVDVEAGAV